MARQALSHTPRRRRPHVASQEDVANDWSAGDDDERERDEAPVRAVLFMFLFLFVFSPTRVSSAAAPPPRVQAFLSLCFVFLFSQRSSPLSLYISRPHTALISPSEPCPSCDLTFRAHE